MSNDNNYATTPITPDDPKHSDARSASWTALLAWAVVVLPALWGVWQTVHQSLALFRHTAG